MRFFENGPNIPNELLEERDNGNVVFFCGAGVSIPAKLPNFLQLTKRTIDKLGTPADDKTRELLKLAEEDREFGPPLDQIFNHLRHQYPRGVIDDVVSRLLRSPTNADVEAHSTILKLSTNASGNPQIVTTNFDLLFERADKSIKKFVPPALPDLARDRPLEGIVYLHGRRAPRATDGISSQGLILSSADFGRAYLADGWATRFVKDLLQNYVIVLIGYSASDPPVRYLLEGLHLRDNEESLSIYAFDQGSEQEVRERWQGRGVHPLAYLDTDSTHSSLWDSLKAWAMRAEDPDAWRHSIVELANLGPRRLKAHQRGQVAAIIRTSTGAKAFATANPPPPADWICVFDRNIRYQEPKRTIGGGVNFDPLVEFGLDDDPLRPPKNGPRTDVVSDDFISKMFFEDRNDDHIRLAGIGGYGVSPLPPRMSYLSNWISTVAKEPTMAWWASQYLSLHSDLVNRLGDRLNQPNDEFHPLARQAWLLLLEKFQEPIDEDYDVRWFRFSERLKKDGWSNRNIRKFGENTRPYLKSSPPFGPPPTESWDNLNINNVVNFDVVFPVRESEAPDIPSEKLLEIFVALRRNLEHGSQLLAEVGTPYWQTATLYSEDKPGEHYLDDADSYLRWFARLFDRLVDEFPEDVRDEVCRWPNDDEYFFNKLKIYAWGKSALFMGKETAEGLVSLSDRGFWDETHRRELLHTIRACWPNCNRTARIQIENRIISGPIRVKGEEDSEYIKYRSIVSAVILGWLEQNDCSLSKKSLATLSRLRKSNPKWNRSWDQSAADSHDSRSGWVATISDPSKIIEAPLAEILQLAERNTVRSSIDFENHLPFQGVVEQKPFKAVAALSYAARNNSFPVDAWRTAISHWPAETPDRLRWLFAHRLARLPSKTTIELRHEIPSWLRTHLPALAQLSLQDALNIWDKTLDQFAEADAEWAQSAIGNTIVAGKVENLSRRTHSHALNSPIGNLAIALLGILDGLGITESAGIPETICSRFRQLVNAPGEGTDHAVSIISSKLRQLFYLDPLWVEQQILPWFDLDNNYSEPAWNGFLGNTRLPSPSLFRLLKSNFLNLFKHIQTWNWRNSPSNRLHEFLVISCYWNLQKRQYVNYKEARIALQETDDQGRNHTLWYLSTLIEEESSWVPFGKSFVRFAWPQESRFQSEITSRHFATIAAKSQSKFPDVVATILPLLIPSKRLDVLIYGMRKDANEETDHLAYKFPRDMLKFLDRIVPNDPKSSPYDLMSALNVIAKSVPKLRQEPRWRRLAKIATGS